MARRSMIALESGSRRRRAPTEPSATPQFFITPVGKSPSASGPRGIDLLHREPRAWGDLTGAAELVRFAFEGGDCAGVFDTLVEALPLAPTSFVVESFASQLHLDALIDSSLHLRIASSSKPLRPNKKVLRRVLETPPSDEADCAARQTVLRELTSAPARRTELERFYLASRKLREALEMATSTEPNLVRRKVGVLVALQESVNALADGFEGATSVLARLAERGRAIKSRDAWERLTQLVDLEGNLATVDVRVRLGSDGTVRGFGVLAIRENQESDLLPGPFMRMIGRLVAFLRGHRYGENEVVVRLLEEVFAPFVDDVVDLIGLTGAVETYLASLGFVDLAKEKGLAACLPSFVEAHSSEGCGERRIEGLFNPLLFLQNVKPKPCDLPRERGDALVVITGPNSGGKTRLLQSLALTQLLGQVGLFVPAARAELRRAPRLFLSLVTDDDAAQIEGRLGTELLRIRKLFEQLEPGAVAILDELCSGTNPDEGEAIFEMVVSLLPKLTPQVFVSTHFLGLAARLQKDRPVESLSFLQVDLDANEKPTYRFVPGVATSSLAHKVAERLGVTREELEAIVAEKLAKKGETS
jgi:DNA mismatch repair protein MutS2